MLGDFTETWDISPIFPMRSALSYPNELSPEGEAPGLLRGFLIGRGTELLEDARDTLVGRVIELGVVFGLGAVGCCVDVDFGKPNGGVMFELFEEDLTVDSS